MKFKEAVNNLGDKTTFAKANCTDMTFLFDEIIFGPVKSRRFGVSLGINLLPVNYKYCTFDCVYCECGWSHEAPTKKVKLPSREDVARALQQRLDEMHRNDQKPDSITFAGNGEPTIHPNFAGIIEDTLRIRDEKSPGTEVTVLTNASLLHKKPVFDALNKVDNNVLKLDSAIEETFRLINRPAKNLRLKTIVENIQKFDGNQAIQTLFVRGNYNGQQFDNTTEKEVTAWLDLLKTIRPKAVMLYPIDRDTAAPGLEKISAEELNSIARRVEILGITPNVYF